MRTTESSLPLGKGLREDEDESGKDDTCDEDGRIRLTAQCRAEYEYEDINDNAYGALGWRWWRQA
jgi:hypothetical protein